MDITLIGHGKMGKATEEVAKRYGHRIVNIFNSNVSFNNEAPSSSICIDFTNADAFSRNYQALANTFKAVIVGTTGWHGIQDTVLDYFKTHNKTIVYANNFSLGINVFFQLVELSSQLLSKLGCYEPYIVEMHHNQKKDAPSGTAIEIEKIIQSQFAQRTQIATIRSGYITGIHQVGFESETDNLQLKHEAYSRKSFAKGAIMAAEWVSNLTGVWNFTDLLKMKFDSILE